MAKKPTIKRKTSVKLNKKSTGRQVEEEVEEFEEEEEEETPKRTGRRTGKRTGRKGASTRRGKKAKEEKKKGGAGMLIGILVLAILGGGGFGAKYYIDNQPKPAYTISKEEKDHKKILDGYVEEAVLSLPKLQASFSKSLEFVELYSKPQVFKEEKLKFYSPSKTFAKELRDDIAEGITQAKRDELRDVDFNALVAAKQQYEIEQEKIKADKAAALKIQLAEEEKVKTAAKHAAEQQAKAEELDSTKPEVRWTLLDSCIFSRPYFKPLDGIYTFDFIDAQAKVDPWSAFALPAQKAWGDGMKKIIASASNTFNILSNSGTDCRDWKMWFKKREGKLKNISKLTFRIEVIDNIEGVEYTRSLEKPIIDIEPAEFYKLLQRAVKPENIKKSKNADKMWSQLKALHEGKSDEQILLFGFASMNYMLKEFPSARKALKEITEIDAKYTELLLAEIKEVEPTYDRREMKDGLEIANALYDDGRRKDALNILDKMKTRFAETAEWGEYEGQYQELFDKASVARKR